MKTAAPVITIITVKTAEFVSKSVISVSEALMMTITGTAHATIMDGAGTTGIIHGATIAAAIPILVMVLVMVTTDGAGTTGTRPIFSYQALTLRL